MTAIRLVTFYFLFLPVDASHMAIGASRGSENVLHQKDNDTQGAHEWFVLSIIWKFLGIVVLSSDVIN